METFPKCAIGNGQIIYKSHVYKHEYMDTESNYSPRSDRFYLLAIENHRIADGSGYSPIKITNPKSSLIFSGIVQKILQQKT